MEFVEEADSRWACRFFSRAKGGDEDQSVFFLISLFVKKDVIGLRSNFIIFLF